MSLSGPFPASPPPSGLAATAKRVTVAVGILAAVAVVVLAAKVLCVLFAGVLLGLVLRSFAKFVAKHTHLPHWAALTLVVLVGVGGTVGGGVALAPAIVDQAATLGRELPRAMDRVRDRIHRIPIVKQSTSPDARELKPAPESVAHGAMTAIGASVEVLGGFAVVFFVGVYGAAQPGAYTDVLLSLVPEAQRKRTRRALDETAGNLTRWLLGRLVAMLFVGVSCAITFLALKVPLALTLAAVAGLLTFVEYIGAVASAVPPVLLAFTKSPSLAVAVLALFTVLHVVEGYLLTPLLARASVRLPPAFTIAGQVLLAALVGPLGLTFATPLLVVAASAVRAWRREDPPEPAG